MPTQRAVTRREFAAAMTAGAAGLFFPPLLPRVSAAEPSSPIDIGSRRELFVDGFLVDRLSGSASLQLHHPVPKEIAITHDAPWEGSGSGYHSVFHDGTKYRMYYKAWQLDVLPAGKVKTNAHPLFCCYAESDNGIRWRKPELGLHEFQGSKKNNIVLAPQKIGASSLDPGHPAVFFDENPDCPAEAKYKALVRSDKPHGLLALKSPDGVHWTPMNEAPVITQGAFDSQNLAFWDPMRREYRAYWRIFTAGVTDEKTWKPAGVRAIRTATSPDFVHWGQHADVGYADSPPEHLYTNQIKPYFRAPHLFIGFPARYIERGWSDSMRALPELENREWRAKASLRYGVAVTEGLIMASRDGVKFKRWNEAFLRPGIEREGTWNYGHQYIAWHTVQTKSDLPGAPDELSLYAVESYWTGNSSALRRYTLRLDGFVSVNAPMTGGEIVTRPVIFKGSELHLNFSTSAAGSIQIEIQDESGKPIPGFALADCAPIFGDAIERKVSWESGHGVSPRHQPDQRRDAAATLSALSGKPVRLRFVIKDADLYAFQFLT